MCRRLIAICLVLALVSGAAAYRFLQRLVTESAPRRAFDDLERRDKRIRRAHDAL